MSNLGIMVGKIRADLNRGTSHDLRIKQAIEDAIRFYKATRFGWNTKHTTVDFGVGDEFIDLPTDWVETDGMTICEGTKRDPLSEVGATWIDDHLRDSSYTSKPNRYAIQNGQIRLYPPPDKSYSLAIDFLCALNEVSQSASDGATNAWMEDGEELIRKHAMADLMVTYIGGEAVQVGLVLKNEVQETLLPKLESQAARQEATGKIRPSL